MKTVKTVAGMKKIDCSNEMTAIIQLKEILKEHRAVLVNRIIESGLTTYIGYKFNVTPEKTKLAAITDKLYALKNSAISIEKYNVILEQFFSKDVTHLIAEPFYKEIDENISDELNPSQLALVS